MYLHMVVNATVTAKRAVQQSCVHELSIKVSQSYLPAYTHTTNLIREDQDHIMSKNGRSVITQYVLQTYA